MGSSRIKVSEGTRRCEIHALQFAICQLMSRLNDLLYFRVKDWRPSQTLNLEVSNVTLRGTTTDMMVFVRPVNWPVTDLIAVRCFKFGAEERRDDSLAWVIDEGSIHTKNIPEIDNLRFKCIQRGVVLVLQPSSPMDVTMHDRFLRWATSILIGAIEAPIEH